LDAALGSNYSPVGLLNPVTSN